MSPEQLRAAIEQTQASMRMASAIDRAALVIQLHDMWALARVEPIGYLLTRDGSEVELVNGTAHVSEEPS